MATRRAAIAILLAGLLVPSVARADEGVRTAAGWAHGSLRDGGPHVILGAGARERRFPKHAILDVETSDRDLELDLLANRLVDLDEGDPDLASLRRRVRDRTAGDLEALAAALAKGPYRPPAEVGTIRFPVTVPADGGVTECALDVPPGYDPARAAPLVVGIHFTGGTGPQALRMLQRTTRRLGALLACPTGTVGRREGWSFTESERSLHREVIRLVRRRYRVDPARIVLTGWSRGGHASWDLGVRMPDVVAGIVPVVGGLTDRDAGLVGNLVGRPVRAFQGARDQPALVTMHRRAAAMAKEAGVNVVYVEDPGRGHDLFLDRAEAALRDVLEEPRPAAPRRVAFATQTAPAAAWWVRIDELGRDAYRPGAPLRIAGARRLEGEALREKMVGEIRRRTARVEAEIRSDGSLDVRTRNVRRLTLLLPRGLVDPDGPVVVRLNGRRREPEVFPDAGVMLETVRLRGARDLLPWGAVTLTGQ